MEEKQNLIEQIKELLQNYNDVEILYIIRDLLLKTLN